MKYLYFATFCFLFSCSHTHPYSHLDLSKILYESNTYNKGWQTDYDIFILQNLTPAMLSKKPADYWPKFFKALSKAESNHNPQATYKESFKNGKNKRVISSGLLQVSLESGLGYKCPFKSQKDLFKPLLNLKCGLMIMDRWIQRDGVIYGKKSSNWKGGARYWSVLRENGSKGHRKFVKALSAKPSSNIL